MKLEDLPVFDKTKTNDAEVVDRAELTYKDGKREIRYVLGVVKEHIYISENACLDGERLVGFFYDDWLERRRKSDIINYQSLIISDDKK